MIKVKKISLQNFKGIKSKSIFNFDNDGACVNVLSGPNGFGKTTVFDVIEICLTGEFKRVEYFDNVQKKTASRNKPFFQNSKGEDVILKLQLYNTVTETNYVVIKHYDEDEGPKRMTYGRNFIPADAGNLFATYLTSDEENFINDNFTNLTQSNQAEINALFFGNNSTIDLKSTYYLFNYIQQEDSIYFLRKNEVDKGVSLGFLFNIENEEANKQRLLGLRNSLSSQQNAIQEQIVQLKESLPNAQRGEYQKLFQDKNFDFDKEYPFSQISSARNQLAPFQDIINSLTLLKRNFSTDEYEKSIKFKKLNDEVIDNIPILNAILLRNIYRGDLLGTLEATNTKIAVANRFRQTPNTVFILKEYFDLFLPALEEYSTYFAIENGIKELEKDLVNILEII